MNQKQLELERDLYRLLLGIGSENGIGLDKSLSEALHLVVRITGARIGYIEFRDAVGKKWWSTYHCSEEDLAAIRMRISEGIIAEALESNKIVFTPSAFLDPRFRFRESVQEGRIESVLCAPFSDGETRGIIYLQGDSAVQFDPNHSMMETGLFARHITPLLRRLKYQIRPSDSCDEMRARFRLESVIGDSEAMHHVLREAMVIAEIDVTALIMGETGTGKNLLAKTIHDNSPRRNRPFVHLNCGALPDSLVESELFGAVKGAHSSAFYDVKGKIAAADGGTLFLDEIGELSLAAQVKLLQFLEDGSYYPLGSQSLAKPDVRVIAASNQDFAEAIRKGSFREDLYFRIQIFPVEMPALRNRREDILPLSRFFIGRLCKKFNLPPLELSESTAQMLKESSWPGNVRELENRIQQGLLRAKAEASPDLRIKHILGEVKPEVDILEDESTTYRQGKDNWEKNFIEAKLQQNDWNVSETAKLLDLSRSQLNFLIKRHNLERPNESAYA